MGSKDLIVYARLPLKTNVPPERDARPDHIGDARNKQTAGTRPDVTRLKSKSLSHGRGSSGFRRAVCLSLFAVAYNLNLAFKVGSVFDDDPRRS